MPAEPQIVVLRPGRRRASALCFLSAPGAGGGLAGPARAAERTRRTGRPARPVHGRLALADRLAHQFLHRGDRLGDLGRPAHGPCGAASVTACSSPSADVMPTA